MKYPYIGKCEENELTVIFSDNGSGTTIDKGESDIAINGKFECGFNEREFKNITAEYLANTYGEVKSKEHAEFIVKLAEVNKIQAVNPWREGLLFCFYYNSDGDLILAFYPEKSAKSDGEKQITIPLLPECEGADEWPKVGDEVEAKHDSGQVLKGELLAITSEYAIIQQVGHEQHLHLSAWLLSKPKTPEQELFESFWKEVGLFMNQSNLDKRIFESAFINNIKKKGEGDE